MQERQVKTDKDFLKIAILEAEKAYNNNEVPVGSVIVRNGEIISKAHNMVEEKQNSLCHAEIISIDRASRKLNNWRLNNCTIYVTLKPCDMCMGAIDNSRISRVVYILDNEKETIDVNKGNIKNNINNSNSNLTIEKDNFGSEKVSEMLKGFFKKVRNEKKR